MENRTCFKTILWKQNLFWEYIIKALNASKYWFHEVVIVGTYFFVFYEIERIVIYDLSTEKFIENIKINEMKKSIYKGKQKLRGGNGAERGHGINLEDDNLENKILSGYSLIVNDCGRFATKMDVYYFALEKWKKRKEKINNSLTSNLLKLILINY